MMAFRISLVVAPSELVNLVADLNLKTSDGYIEREARINEDRWLVTVAVTDRDEAGFVRFWPLDVAKSDLMKPIIRSLCCE